MSGIVTIRYGRLCPYAGGKRLGYGFLVGDPGATVPGGVSVRCGHAPDGPARMFQRLKAAAEAEGHEVRLVVDVDSGRDANLAPLPR